jgi:hypothetical protein
MKEFWKIAFIATITIALSVLATLAIIKWEGHHLLPQNYDSSVQVTQADINNPVIMSIADALELQQKMNAEQEIDSLFLAMGKTDMRNVIGVLQNKGATNIMKCDIVNEFKAGKEVYENLPSPDSKSDKAQDPTKIAEITLENVATTTVTEAPPTRVEDSKQPAKDTIINGKKYKQVE